MLFKAINWTVFYVTLGAFIFVYFFFAYVAIWHDDLTKKTDEMLSKKLNFKM